MEYAPRETKRTAAGVASVTVAATKTMNAESFMVMSIVSSGFESGSGVKGKRRQSTYQKLCRRFVSEHKKEFQQWEADPS